MRIGNDAVDRNRAKAGKRHVANGRAVLQNLLQRAADDFDRSLRADNGIGQIHHIAEQVADFGGHQVRRVVCRADSAVAQQIRRQQNSRGEQIDAEQHDGIKRQLRAFDQLKTIQNR